MLHQQIKDEIKTALKARDLIRLSVLRGLAAAFTNDLVAKKQKPDEILTDDEAIAVIRRQAKQRQDSMAQFSAGGRQDLVKAETAELAIIESYLPALMSVDQIKTMAEAKKIALGLADKSQAGQLMSELMKDLKGRADGAAVKTVVDQLFG